VLRQNGDDLLERHDFDILFDARMLSARKMALIRHAWFANCLPIDQNDLRDSRMELRNFRQIHGERPHRFEWRVDDYPLLESKWRPQSFLQIGRIGFGEPRERDYFKQHDSIVFMHPRRRTRL